MNISDIAININDGTITLPAAAAELDGARLRVLFRLAADERLRSDYSAAADGAALELGLDRVGLDRAVTELAERGLLSCAVTYGAKSGAGGKMSDGAASTAQPPSENTAGAAQSPSDGAGGKTPTPQAPAYSGMELAELLERDDGRYGQLVDECQRALGRIFTGSETSKLVALCDYMGMEPEFVLLVCAYCAGKGKNSVRYVERTACGLTADGVDDAVKLDAYIKQKDHYKTMEYKLREMLGLGSRALTKKEHDIMGRWIDVWQFDPEIIARAYEITVGYTDRASLPYMDKILENWYTLGYRTLEDISAAEDKRKTEKAALNSDVAPSFDTDEFFELALKRSYAKIGGEAAKPDVKDNVPDKMGKEVS